MPPRTLAALAYNALLSDFFVGLLLGGIVWALDLSPQGGSVFGASMAIVVVLAGAASFVCYSLDRVQSARLERAQDWVVTIGIGILIALHGLASLAH